MTEQLQNAAAAYQAVLLKAAEDDAFRTSLEDNPKAVLSKELGVELPEDLRISVVSNTPTELTLVLPPRSNGELSDAELDNVNGGVIASTLLVAGAVVGMVAVIIGTGIVGVYQGWKASQSSST